ncbi:MAG: tetratricopeptide repeat protein, partial [Alphaproteobacteria bacterium]|nr:tetratricopeptide repeat protein [Alphaproteobacteria bacterium]
GNAWRDTGDHDRAIADYIRAIELNPKDALPFYNRGVMRLTKGDFDRAIADLNRAIELNPKYAYAYMARGIAHEDRRGGDLASALTDFRTFVRLSPNDPLGPKAVSRIEAKIDAQRRR